MKTELNPAEYDAHVVDRVNGKMVYEVHRSQARKLIRSIGKRGQMLTVTFRKKDGSVRQMTGRFGCHKKAAELNKTGVNRNTHADFPQYERIMEVTAGVRDLKGKFRAPECQFRTFNLDTLIKVNGAGSEFLVYGTPCYSE